MLNVITVPSLKKLIQPSSWKDSKLLADDHLDILKLCQYGCRYCSSNAGLHIRFAGKSIEQAVNQATGESFDPHNVKDLALVYKDVIPQLDAELTSLRKKPGRGKTIVFSQLTDGFSPILINTGATKRALELLLERTEYRIRVLTKNAIVGRKDWVDFFSQHRERFVVGLSIGTTNNNFSKRMELLTSLPTSRLKALGRLQEAGVPTYGMLCPVFPHVLESTELEKLLEQICPELCEHVWAEPYNNRFNWQGVMEGYSDNPKMYQWMTSVYEDGNKAVWSQYATDLYGRIALVAKRDGWIGKLRYLLYEGDITPKDAKKFGDGVLLQSLDENGVSKNPAFARKQSVGRK